ncbi:cobalt-precorrin 5A hydrolase/precorrin-3B C17-methyltransferase [Crossiella equi]|uniref:Cobalt-precorrin 5A hydrolase/precorrin-3B C17-methyltransferase n=1 Tax=Crossiella equi TaxID=130796 RepID=A0ABS5AL46_9PSEU|nr:cobalamin biosynthesis protein [Crossiella equi]MBP2477141.1 cobalt-precorrin 5A hydrolase/precorrin-3B C17-methyltransferase [Crossiella equi]
MIGLFAASVAGRQAAAELAGRLGPSAVLAEGPVRPALERLWPELSGAVFFLATDSTIRLVAPLLRERHNDPAVVCVDEAERFAVALVDGPAGNARALAEEVAQALGGTAVVTAAQHATGTTPLDDLVELLDAAVEGELTECGAAVLAGERVRLANPLGFPLPALPANVVLADNALGDESPQWTVLVDDRLPSPEPEGRLVRLIPRTLVVGLGASSGVSTTAVTTAVAALTDQHDLDARAILAFATLDTKAGERAVTEAVEDHGFWADRTPRLLAYPAETLATVPVPNPSLRAAAHTGTPSVAEAAALHAATTLADGAPTELAAPKTARGQVTVAAARIRPRGRLAVVHLGPAAADLRVPRAEAELRKAAVVVGAQPALDRARPLTRPGTELWVSATAPEAVRQALELARQGRAVALLGDGDHALARALAEHAAPHRATGPSGAPVASVTTAPSAAGDPASADPTPAHPTPAAVNAPAEPPTAPAEPSCIDVLGVPGLSPAAVAVTVLLGAPPPGGHVELVLPTTDPWPSQEQRVRALAATDLPVCLAPTTRWRTHTTELLAALRAHRPPTTPVGLVHAVGRPGEHAHWTRLAHLDPSTIDPTTAVLLDVPDSSPGTSDH